MIQHAEVSVVKGSSQTNHFTNRKRPCTTTENEERAICQSLLSGPSGFFRDESNAAAGWFCVIVAVAIVSLWLWLWFWCMYAVCVVCVVCGVTHAEKPPCVRSKRSVCTGNTYTCVNTCVCGAGTHGDVLNVHTAGRGSSSVLLTKFYPRSITCPRGSRKTPMHLFSV